jgi:DNA (cytosine-5)-methyltransferase 1
VASNGIFVDSFAGGGGASLGITWATGRSPDVAINHDPLAIVMHAANHPDTKHFTEDVWKLKSKEITGGRKVAGFWASPDCTHFSRAKGGRPVKKEIRSLAWFVVRFAAEAKPDVIFLENVREFADWGPIVPALRCAACRWRGTEGQVKIAATRHRCPRCNSLRLKETEELIPDPARKGLTFRRWIGRLRGLGYEVEWKNMNAADYGVPTHRRRLFLIGRRDSKPIVWPEKTHAPPEKCANLPLFGPTFRPYHTAAECIDWSIPCPSIFDRPKPLADATMRRIAMGVGRYVLNNPRPFIVGVGGRMGQSPAAPVDQPSNTVTGKNDRSIVIPILSQYHSSKSAGDCRCQPADRPINVVPTENRFALVSAFLAKHYGGHTTPGSRCNAPIDTITETDHNSLVSVFLAKHFGDGHVGAPIDTPFPTITAIPNQNQIVAANLIRMNNGAKQWNGVDEPLPTVTTQHNKLALVYSFLVKYFGTAIGQHLTEPLHTITGKDRFGLVTVWIDGDLWVLTDIGMRMLTPRELARAQGFPDSYLLTHPSWPKRAQSKSAQVARIGNSVCPHMAELLVRANYPSLWSVAA